VIDLLHLRSLAEAALRENSDLSIPESRRMRFTPACRQLVGFLTPQVVLELLDQAEARKA